MRYRGVVLLLVDLGREDMAARPFKADSLLTPAEVAKLFRVDPKTVTRWGNTGKLGTIRTLGGHRRFLESEVRAVLSSAIPVQRGPSD